MQRPLHSPAKGGCTVSSAGRWIICAEVQGGTPTPPPCKRRVHSQFSGALEDMSGKGRKVSTHRCLIGVHVRVSQRCRPPDVEPATRFLQNARTQNVPAGRWRKGLGRRGRRASSTHLSFVRDHIAAVEIGHATRVDIEPSSILFQRKASTCVTFQRGAGVSSGTRGA